MDQLPAILSIATGFLALFGAIAKLAYDLGQLKQTVVQLEKDGRDARGLPLEVKELQQKTAFLEVQVDKNKQHDDARITELFESRNASNQDIADIKKDVSYLIKGFDEFKQDLKAFMATCRGDSTRSAGI